jgi:hypothetical protein
MDKYAQAHYIPPCPLVPPFPKKKIEIELTNPKSKGVQKLKATTSL